MLEPVKEESPPLYFAVLYLVSIAALTIPFLISLTHIGQYAILILVFIAAHREMKKHK